jgi:hypothetical protein
MTKAMGILSPPDQK